MQASGGTTFPTPFSITKLNLSMLVCALLLLISCFARTACAALLASTLVSPSDVVPGKFIVEFDAEGHQSGYADVSWIAVETLTSTV